MYSRLRFDITIRDLLFGLCACAWAWDRRKLAGDVARACSPGGEQLICFSVRSAFDLLLQALALPAGSEVLVSAVTHPDMVRIIERHELRAVPVDLDPATLAPRTELVERAVSPRTRAILVAHLFGGRVNLSPIADLAREHGLLLLEDCAQAFRGPHDNGDPLADVSMFSFGPLKTATALGGAILYARDHDLLREMREMQSSWQVQRRRAYLVRLLRFLFLVQATRPVVYRLIFLACDLLGRDFDALVNSAARAFPAEGRAGTGGHHSEPEALFERIRRQPSAPLLALLARRLRTFDPERLRSRARVGEEISRRLSPSVEHPGGLASSRTHWLLPVTPRDPDSLIPALHRAGFDATRKTSNIAVVEAPPDLPDRAPPAAARMMSRIVFLPTYPELTEEAIERLARSVNESAGGAGRGDVWREA